AAIAALLPVAAPGAVAARGDARSERPLRGERVDLRQARSCPSRRAHRARASRIPTTRKSGGPVVALPGREQAAVAVRPGVGGAAPDRPLELVHDSVSAPLRGSAELEAVRVTVDGDDAPLGLRAASWLWIVLDAAVDGR